ncbi:MAG: hypothetical protein MUQ65_12015 [Armatimonadetes bacterium]|nr:hypothetical protein [Armatimonadota bacterium]
MKEDRRCTVGVLVRASSRHSLGFGQDRLPGVGCTLHESTLSLGSCGCRRREWERPHLLSVGSLRAHDCDTDTSGYRQGQLNR